MVFIIKTIITFIQPGSIKIKSCLYTLVPQIEKSRSEDLRKTPHRSALKGLACIVIRTTALIINDDCTLNAPDVLVTSPV